jgi:steroid 5-alpha reductase family enzyme
MKKLLVLLIIVAVGCGIALLLAANRSGAPSVRDYVEVVSPLTLVIVLALGLSAAAFVTGTVTNDYSWVDRLWSTAPVGFAWVYAARYEFALPVVVLALLVTVWGARLTYNFARRGGYTHMEDYRWPILRKRIGNEALWHLFSLLFVSGFQIALFVGFTLPIYAVGEIGAVGNGGLILAAAVAIAALGWETIADQHQFEFQNIKHGDSANAETPSWFGRGSDEDRRTALRADIERGFLTHGLFAVSRHPNYFGELLFWWAIFIASAAASIGAGGSVLHWSGLGPLVLTALFVGSTVFTESISAARYPGYKDYQRAVSAIVPLPPRDTLDDEVAAESR